jgi:hypothetical protein
MDQTRPLSARVPCLTVSDLHMNAPKAATKPIGTASTDPRIPKEKPSRHQGRLSLREIPNAAKPAVEQRRKRALHTVVMAGQMWITRP